MLKTKKRRCGKFNEEKISNSYGSTNCIRFEGIISARVGHPFVFTGTKIGNLMKKHKIGVDFFLLCKPSLHPPGFAGKTSGVCG